MNRILPSTLQTAAEELAESLAAAEPIAAYLRAKERLDADPQARALLDRLASTQSELRVRQATGALTPSDITSLRDLQRQVQANSAIMDYVTTQQAATAYLLEINQEISLLIGMDFASLAGAASC